MHRYNENRPLTGPSFADRVVRLGILTLVAGAFMAACGDATSPFGGPSGGVANDTPQVTLEVSPSPLGLDTVADVRVTATDRSGIDSIGYRVEAAATDELVFDTMEVADADEVEFTDTFDPAGLAPQILRFIGFAFDADTTALQGADTVEVELTDIRAPDVTILEPDSGQQLPTLDTLEVEVEFLDDQAGLDVIEVAGYAFRGDSAQATDLVVIRFGPEVRQYSTPWRQPTTVSFRLPPVNDSAEVVHVVAKATDAVGNVAADTVMINVGGPWVSVLAPADEDTASVGGRVNVEIAAFDRNGLSDVWLDYIHATDSVEYRLCCGTVQTDTVVNFVEIELPADPGSVRFVARAKSAGSTLIARDAIAMEVVSTAVADTAPPTAALDFVTSDRIELTDTLTLTLTAKDPGGVDSMAVTVIGLNTQTADTLVFDSTIAFTNALSGTVRSTYKFDMRELYERIDAMLPDTIVLPDTIAFYAYGFAYDQEENCGAASFGIEDGSLLSCGTTTIGGTTYRVADGAAQNATNVLAVTGYTVNLPAGGVIADAVVDTTTGRERLYLSNFTTNAVEALTLDPDPEQIQFLPSPVLVGSQPWGLFIDNSGDTLIVANSGATNITMVDLSLSPPAEVETSRILTPNTPLWEIFTEGGDTEPIKITDIEFIDFADRPQFVAQDSAGRIFYSTVPTVNEPRSTMRLAIRDVDRDGVAEETEIDHQFNFEFLDNENIWAFEGVDSVTPVPSALGNDSLIVYGHVAGDRSTPVIGGPDLIPNAFAAYNANKSLADQAAGVPADETGFYQAVWSRGRWDLAGCCFQDTTYVVASGDRGVLLMGDGDDSQAASEIFAFDAASKEWSKNVEKQDLINNAAERVIGLGLNNDGTLGVARGLFAAYFFTVQVGGVDPLRLQGLFTEEMDEGGAGAVFHPRHRDVTASNDSTLAFVGANKSVKVVDTFHFYKVGDIDIRDTVIGPLKASLPLPSDNAALTGAGFSCSLDNPDPPCIILKLYGVTDSGGVVIVNVRQRDVEP